MELSPPLQSPREGLRERERERESGRSFLSGVGGGYIVRILSRACLQYLQLWLLQHSEQWASRSQAHRFIDLARMLIPAARLRVFGAPYSINLD